MALPSPLKRIPPAALPSALRTLAAAQNGLTVLADALAEPDPNGIGAAFERAVRLIAAARGRVIVTGIGKSGHVGAKIAATLASTGTAAFFVHPAEASHGDMGMIRPEDVVIALSWSGETAELRDIVFYCRRFRVPLVAVTAGVGSTLAGAADVALILPKVEEACPHGLAPTTSSMIQLTLGDALAIALLEHRGFTAEDFKRFHPGGTLGATLAHVRDVMHKGDRMPLAPLGLGMNEALLLISEKRFGCLGIVGPYGALVGIITDGDLRRHMRDGVMAQRVEEVMTPNPRTIEPDALVASALEILSSAEITTLFAVEAGRPVGIVHMHDLLRIGAA